MYFSVYVSVIDAVVPNPAYKNPKKETLQNSIQNSGSSSYHSESNLRIPPTEIERRNGPGNGTNISIVLGKQISFLTSSVRLLT